MLEVQNVEPGDVVGAHVTPVTPHGLVTTGRKGLIAGSGKNNYANCAIITTDVKRVDHFGDRYRGEGIVLFRPVHCNLGDLIVAFKNNFGILLNGGPVSTRHNKLLYKIQRYKNEFT